MKKSVLLSLAVLLSWTTVFGQALNPTPVQTTGKAQNDPKALEILNKASAAYSKAGGVKAGFTIQILAKGGTVKDNVSGTIKLRGSNFKIETGEMITWFDGSNQWVYVLANKEVNLSKPNSKEQLMMNPVNVFQLYHHGYNCKLLSDKKGYQIELKPYVKNDNVASIVATFDKSSYHPVNITITNKNKSGSRISIGSYLTGQNYAESLFTFQQKDYPDAEVVDLR